jgi:type IV pilus assembly protein PilA
MSARFGLLFGKGREQGFTLIELLIVVLIVGILAAVATPLYLGYVKDAKTAEAKAVVGSLWTAVQSEALANCGTPVPVSAGFAKAGLTTGGVTTPARWTVTGSTNTLTVTCATGAYAASVPILFVVDGTVSPDVAFVKVGLHYDPVATPPAVLRCTTDGTTTPAATSPAC